MTYGIPSLSNSHLERVLCLSSRPLAGPTGAGAPPGTATGGAWPVWPAPPPGADQPFSHCRISSGSEKENPWFICIWCRGINRILRSLIFAHNVAIKSWGSLVYMADVANTTLIFRKIFFPILSRTFLSKWKPQKSKSTKIAPDKEPYLQSDWSKIVFL